MEDTPFGVALQNAQVLCHFITFSGCGILLGTVNFRLRLEGLF